jgi:hypothetical protein
MEVGGQQHAAATLPPGDPVPVIKEAGWSLELVWMARRILPPPTFDPRTIQPIVSHYTHYATLTTSHYTHYAILTTSHYTHYAILTTISV